MQGEVCEYVFVFSEADLPRAAPVMRRVFGASPTLNARRDGANASVLIVGADAQQARAMGALEACVEAVAGRLVDAGLTGSAQDVRAHGGMAYAQVASVRASFGGVEAVPGMVVRTSETLPEAVMTPEAIAAHLGYTVRAGYSLR
jgi:hypothetical protein